LHNFVAKASKTFWFKFPRFKTHGTMDDSTVYESSVRFDENRIRAAALYCSDGRFGEQIDDFLHNGLKLPHGAYAVPTFCPMTTRLLPWTAMRTVPVITLSEMTARRTPS